ncbi:MAG: hypothetical protein QOK33_5704, partial [Mycobacterium sp.]|nr:hypothetical protein [Mycobacterium sp.]
MSFRRGKSVLAFSVVVAMTAVMTSCTSTKPVTTNPPPGVNAGPDGKPAPFR